MRWSRSSNWPARRNKIPGCRHGWRKIYLHAIGELAEIGAAEVLRADEAEAVRAILSVIAIAKGLRTHGKFLVEYSDDELLDMESREQ